MTVIVAQRSPSTIDDVVSNALACGLSVVSTRYVSTTIVDHSGGSVSLTRIDGHRDSLGSRDKIASRFYDYPQNTRNTTLESRNTKELHYNNAFAMNRQRRSVTYIHTLCSPLQTTLYTPATNPVAAVPLRVSSSIVCLPALHPEGPVLLRRCSPRPKGIRFTDVQVAFIPSPPPVNGKIKNKAHDETRAMVFHTNASSGDEEGPHAKNKHERAPPKYV